MLFVFALSAFVQISFWILVWVGLERARQSDTPTEVDRSERQPISVIVAVSNEAHHLSELINALSHQHYPRFEVVFVDDGSEDGSGVILNEAAHKDPRIAVISNPPETRGKKGAIARGIASAKHELLAFTDADCRPNPGWLDAIAQRQTSDPAILVGYGPLDARRGFLNALIRFETLTTAMLTAAAIGFRVPYMAVGRNLSYPKSILRRLPDARSGADLLSGDDDLLIQDAAEAGIEVRCLLDPDSFVSSPAPDSPTRWIHQKRRHVSASRAYRPSSQLGLGVHHLTAVACWIAPFVVGWFGFACLVSKLAIQWPVVAMGSRLFREPDLVPKTPILDAALLLILSVVAPFSLLFPPRKW